MMTYPLVVLAEDAIRSAIRDYHSKRSALASSKQPGPINVTQSAGTGETVAAGQMG
jgi:iron-sulfur cluster assembly enzyme ISCU, mitochondrial